MKPPLESPAEEVTRLHDCVNDLVRIPGPTLRRCHYDVTICVPPQRRTYLQIVIFAAH